MKDPTHNLFKFFAARMIRHCSPYSFILFFAFALSSSGLSWASDSEYVKIQTTLAQKRFRANGQGELLVRFRPMKGIHINLEPAIRLVLEENQDLSLVQKQPRPPKTRKGYLDTSKPLKYRFKVSSGASPGSFLLKAKLKYFYCSDEEGWCRMETEEIQMPLLVIK